MDNKEAVEILRENCCYLAAEYEEALNLAIASLEKWDKVKKDILSRTIINDKPGTYVSGVSNGLSIALGIMEEHLGEVDEN